jgi:hypothetical protein
MVGDPRDRTTYAIAFATLGLALAVLLAGICWLAVQHGTVTEVLSQQCALHPLAHCRPEVSIHHETDTPYIPGGLWIVLAALGGVLVGGLIPSPLWASKNDPSAGDRARRLLTIVVLGILVLVVGVVAALTGTFDDVSLPTCALLAAAAGVLLGLPIPSPGRGD